jgi:LacI family transcriptional regulator
MATIKDVAKQAGVSISTVSRVINSSGYVAKDKKESVLKAMKELNFQPNLIARGLVQGQTSTVGLLIPDITNPFFADIARGVEDTAINLGFNVILCNSDWKLDREQLYLSLLKSKKVDGVIVVGTRSKEQTLLKALEPLPFVFVDRKVTKSKNCVWVDHEKGACKAVLHLLEKGCQNIVHVTGPDKSPSALSRKKGYELMMKKHHLKSVLIPSDFRFEGGYKSGELLFEQKNIPDGIFAGNDLLALGIIQAAIERGIKVPDDVLIVGYDNIEMSKIIQPTLSTIGQPAYEMGCGAFKMLHRKLTDSAAVGSEILEFEPVLIPRGSTQKEEQISSGGRNLEKNRNITQ